MKNFFFVFFYISFQTCQFFLSIFNHLKKYFFLLFKIKHHPTSRKKQNEKLFFFVFFFGNSKHIFFVLTRVNFFSNLNDIIKFINTKQDPFFFYRKSQHTCICFINNLQKKNQNRGVSSHVLNSSNFAKGMVLPKASSLSSLHAWFRLKGARIAPHCRP